MKRGGGTALLKQHRLLGYLTEYRKRHLEALLDAARVIYRKRLLTRDPKSWFAIQDCTVVVANADLAIARASLGLLSNAIFSGREMHRVRGKVKQQHPRLWRRYWRAQQALFEATTHVDEWVELVVEQLARWGLEASDPAEMYVVDEWLLHLAPALGDRRVNRTALRKELLRAQAQEAAQASADARRKKKPSRIEDRKRRYQELLKVGLAKRMGSRDASAAAIKTLASEENVTAERIRRVVEPRRRATNLS